MKTSELVAFLKSSDYTSDEQAYNLLVNDMWECCTEPEIIASQRLISYFNYKIMNVLLPVIKELSNGT